MTVIYIYVRNNPEGQEDKWMDSRTKYRM